MAIFVTGGFGKTATPLIKFLQEAKIPYIVGSRKGAAGAPSGVEAIKFDWLDPSTFDAPFQHSFSGGEKITGVYLVGPSSESDPVGPITALIDLAVKKYEVKRFTFLTGSSAQKGGPQPGQIWEHLDKVGAEYSILKATWFIDNFSQWQHHKSIKEEGKIYTGTGDGKIPFISALDIAAVGFHALTGKKVPKQEYDIHGPELLTHDEIATKLSKALGREITHVKLSQEQSVQQWKSIGTPEPFAQFLAYLENNAKEDKNPSLSKDVEEATGRAPQSFDAWVQLNKNAWD